MNILVVGLDAAGKTTMFYLSKLGDCVTTTPTPGIFLFVCLLHIKLHIIVYLDVNCSGFHVETYQYKNIKFILYNVGIRGIKTVWKDYYPDTKAVIFVVDSNDIEKMNTAKYELHKMLQEPELKDVVLLIMANKQDLPNALTPDQVQDKLAMTYCNPYHEPENLKSIRQNTLLNILPDRIIEIISVYIPSRECLPSIRQIIQPSTLYDIISKQYLSDEAWNGHMISELICQYLPAIEGLGVQTRCKVFGSCATTGEGVYEGLDWMANRQSENKQTKEQKKDCCIL